MTALHDAKTALIRMREYVHNCGPHRIMVAELQARIAGLLDTLHSIDPARLLNEHGAPDTQAVVNATLALSDGTGLRRGSIWRLASQIEAGGWGAGLRAHQAPDELVPFRVDAPMSPAEAFDPERETPYDPVTGAVGLAAAGGRLIGDMLLDRFQLKVACPWMALRGQRPEMRDVELLIPRVSVIVTPDMRLAIILEQLDALLP